MREPKRKFKGVWICKALWLHPTLTWLQKCLVAEIDSLSDENEGCGASDSYLADMFSVKAKTISNMLSQLRSQGVIETVLWDGNKRQLRVAAGLAAESPNLFLKNGNTSSRNPGIPLPGIDESALYTDTSQKEEAKTGAAKPRCPFGVKDFLDGWIDVYQVHHGKPYVQQNRNREAKEVRGLLEGGVSHKIALDTAIKAWGKRGYPFDLAVDVCSFCRGWNKIVSALESKTESRNSGTANRQSTNAYANFGLQP